LQNEECYLTTFYCNQHLKKNCDFKLIFKSSIKDSNGSNKESRKYLLSEWSNHHTQVLDSYDNCDRITQKIQESIQRLKGRCKDAGCLTQEINDQFQTNFKTRTINQN